MAADEAGEARPRVILANINRGELSLVFVQGLVSSLVNGSILSMLLAQSGPYLDRGRNRVVARCREVQGPVESGLVPWEWLLFVDSDIEFMHTHIDQLLAPTLDPLYNPLTHPLMCGLYYSPFDDHPVPGEPGFDGTPLEMTEVGPAGLVGPVTFEWVERRFPEMPDADDPIWAFRRLSRATLATLPPVNESWNPRSPDHAPTPSPICQVAAAGTGFMAIHTSLLDTMADTFPLPLPFFDEPVINGVHLGEDLAFCRRVTELGYPVLVNRACVVLHHKTMRIA